MGLRPTRANESPASEHSSEKTRYLEEKKRVMRIFSK
jgi:hypothetical protein